MGGGLGCSSPFGVEMSILVSLGSGGEAGRAGLFLLLFLVSAGVAASSGWMEAMIVS